MASVTMAAQPVKVCVGGQTDIGGGRENQDMWFCWKDGKGSDTTVFGVLDGHGREVGRLAAISGRDALMDWLERPTSMEQIRKDPVKTFGRMFAHAHLIIKQNFRHSLETAGWQVNEAPEGFLTRRRHESQPWSCLHGGASCSVMALVDGRLFSANVGDSSTLMSVSDVGDSASSVMVPSHCAVRLCDLGSANLHESTESGFVMEKAFLKDAQVNLTTGNEQTEEQIAAEATLNTLLSQCQSVSGDSKLTKRAETLPLEPTLSYVVSADHSPEAHTEFERLRRTRPKPSDPRSPDLMMVYDSPTTSGSKSACPQVFQHQSAVNTAVNTTNTASVNTASVNTDDGGSADSDGVPVITNRGKYYKNVRSEWASLVATPATARFQDALAFTRSLGDFHLQSYGVCYLPEVFEIDLTAILPTPSAHKMITLLVCSDGIWDNWKFEDVTQFTLNKEHMLSSLSEPPITAGSRLIDPLSEKIGAQLSANNLIDRNAKLAHANFGNSADNATAVVAFLWR